MTILIFLFVTLVCAALQAAVPTIALAGHAPLPFLSGVVIYYALTHRTSRLIPAAILIGILDDSLGMIPLGVSSFCYAAMGLIIARFRGVMTIHAVTTHAFLGAVANFATTLITWLLLVREGGLHWTWGWMLGKFVGSIITGALLVPVIFSILWTLDHLSGRARYEEADPL